MANFKQITPFLHVDDVASAVTFFTDILGFRCYVQSEEYAYVEREGAAMRILKASQDEGEQVPPGNRRAMYYIDVEDVEAVAAELKPKLATLENNPGYGPVDQGYGQREFMLVAPDGNLLVYGQPVRREGGS